MINALVSPESIRISNKPHRHGSSRRDCAGDQTEWASGGIVRLPPLPCAPLKNDLNPHQAPINQTSTITTMKVDAFQTKHILTLERLVGSNLLLPAIQRALDEDVVHEIVDIQKRNLHTLGTFLFLGDIVVTQTTECETETASGTTKWILVDGQHRFAAIQRIYMLQPTYEISVLVIRVQPPALTMEDVFICLNKSRPVPKHIIDSTLEISKRNLLDDFKAAFMKKFKVYLSKSTQPRKPNVHIDALLDTIASEEGRDMRNKLHSGDRIFKYMLWVNTNQWKHRLDQKTQDICCQKQPHCPLFICADRENDWIDRVDWMDSFLQDTGILPKSSSTLPPIATTINTQYHHQQQQHHQPQHQQQQPQHQQQQHQYQHPQNPHHQKQQPDQHKKKKRHIPKAIKQQVWENHFGTNQTKGPCPCCQIAIVSCFRFDAGHIVSEANGGSTMVSNLLPICSSCNNSMGTMNMNEYVAQFYGRTLMS
jgi:hypothetical protein